MINSEWKKSIERPSIQLAPYRRMVSSPEISGNRAETHQRTVAVFQKRCSPCGHGCGAIPSAQVANSTGDSWPDLIGLRLQSEHARLRQRHRQMMLPRKESASPPARTVRHKPQHRYYPGSSARRFFARNSSGAARTPVPTAALIGRKTRHIRLARKEIIPTDQSRTLRKSGQKGHVLKRSN